jgi:hypothetical protein
VIDELREHGLLLMQDKKIASVVALITGEALATSWWSHPRSHEIFRTLEKLGDDRDVLVTRLIAGKVTYVHRRLWPSFLAIAASGAEWQKRGLRAKPSTRELQERLLVAAEEVHTESGRHEMRTQTWHAWAKEHAAKIPRVTPAAYAELEEEAVKIGATARMLPWNRF